MKISMFGSMFGLLAVLLFTIACPAKADSVGTVTFADVPSNCGFAVGPCTGMVPDEEVWSGSFSMDLQTGEVLSDVISGIGPGTGPWTNHVGIVVPACLLGPTEGGGSFNNSQCALGWSDAQGWSIQWDPGNYDDGILSSTAIDFFGMGEFVSAAATYSVNIPEPPTILLLVVALVLVWAWRSRNRVHHRQIV
jgi:hypothetical protein